MKAPVLPRYTGGDVGSYLDALVSKLEQVLVQSPSGRPYAVTNGTPTRTLNVTAAATSDVAKVLGTLISDLKAGSIIA